MYQMFYKETYIYDNKTNMCYWGNVPIFLRIINITIIIFDFHEEKYVSGTAKIK